MRTGSLARSLARLVAGIAALTAVSAAPLAVQAQAPRGNYRMMHPHDTGGQFVGSPQDCGPGPMYGCSDCGDGYGMPQPGFNGPMPMGYGGTNPPIGYDLMNDVGVEGYQVDQRGPYYFDVRAEAVYLRRDDQNPFDETIDFTAEGQGGPIVLSSDQLEYDWEPGFRIIGRYDLCPLSVLEFGYMGIYSFEDSARYVDPNAPDLFSLFSDFGNELVFPNVTDPGGPAPQTERAAEHSIELEMSIQNAEISYRRYWLGWHPRVSGTLMAGFRYTRINEEFEFDSIGSETVPFNDPFGQLATMDYDVDADNDMPGFQTGADIWVGLWQGVRIGAEGKAGLYANFWKVQSDYNITPPENPLDPFANPLFLGPEEFDDMDPAFIAEASVDLVADILPSVSLRVGYEVFFVDSIVLATDNINTGSPYNPGPVDNGMGPLRTPFVDDDSDLFLHGGHAGIEWIW